MDKRTVLLSIILIIGTFLRYYNINWGAPYFFHPDEKNMGVAVSQFYLPKDIRKMVLCLKQKMKKTALLEAKICNLNPYFFAYGQFPLYLAYFSGYLRNAVFKTPTISLDLPQSIFWLRFWSATASILTIFLVFLIAGSFLKFRGAILAALFCAFTAGLIQSAHFGTTESLLTLFFLTIIYFSLVWVAKKISVSSFIFLTSFFLGLAAATKISAWIYFFIPIMALFLRYRPQFLKTVFASLIIGFFSWAIFLAASPYNFLDFQAFKNSMNYEGGVALGKVKVFYTRQFENTKPIIFQFTKIFPYVLGYPLFILGFLGFLLANFELIGTIFKKRKLAMSKREELFFLLNFAFLIYFLPNAFLFTKWTRFMTPLFPLFSIYTGYFLFCFYGFFKMAYYRFKDENKSLKNNKILKFLELFLAFSLLFLVLLPGIVFFTVYLRTDTRIQASEWIYQNIPSGSYILSETANVVDLPVVIEKNYWKAKNYRIVSFNFYELDESYFLQEELVKHLEKADYILVPSRRVFANNMRLPNKYPISTRYYELFFSGELGFEKVAEFSVLSDEASEETFTVFDHPVVRVYKKKIHYNQKAYQNLFSL